MTRALVLSGGGPVGIAWQSGLAVGLARRGVQLGDADLIVGTSAGSAVGAQLALGHDLEARVARYGEVAPDTAAENAARGAAPSPEGMRSGVLAGFFAVMTEAAQDNVSEEELRRRLGAFALGATTGTEDAFVDAFAYLAGAEWPTHYCCTAVDAETGSFQVWDAKAGAPMERAVASSCAVPGVFPPITIYGKRYIDGGMRSSTNADLAAGHDKVLIVSLMRPGRVNIPGLERYAQRAAAEEAAITDAGGELWRVHPDDEATAAIGLNLMDGSLGPAAAAAGVKQGEREAEQLAAFWD